VIGAETTAGMEAGEADEEGDEDGG